MEKSRGAGYRTDDVENFFNLDSAATIKDDNDISNNVASLHVIEPNKSNSEDNER